jgi:hypothetical protein
VLKLNNKAMRGTNISDVLFPGFLIILDKFLAFSWEIVFPSSMPVGFRFGPRIAVSDSTMCPMGDPMRSAFSDDLAITAATHTFPSEEGFNTLTVCKCILH